jgi:hypothetical protein
MNHNTVQEPTPTACQQQQQAERRLVYLNSEQPKKG